LLANKYSEKLAAVQQRHAEELAQLQQLQEPDAADLRELREQVTDLEHAVSMYVGLVHERERELNEQLHSLARLTQQQADYIASLEKEEEELDARLVVMEGRVRGVVKEARAWNAREKELVARLKEESLLVVHLAQREQQMLNEQREWAARVERAEKKTRELEEELQQVQQYHAARERMTDAEAAGSRKSSGEDVLRTRGSTVSGATTLSGLVSPVMSPVLSSLSSMNDKGTPPVPPVPPRSSSRRGSRAHQRSESLGVSMLQQMRDSEAALSQPTILINDVPSPVVSASVSAHSSPRGDHGHLQQHLPPPPPLRGLEETKASRGSHVMRSTAPNVNNGSTRGVTRRKSFSKADMDAVGSSSVSLAPSVSSPAGQNGSSAASQEAAQQPPAVQLAVLASAEDGKEPRRQRRGTRKMERPSADSSMDGVSAEVLASVEAEIALLLKK
jgi:hypothetical protein